MHIAIVGTGSVGSALGQGWAKADHMVTFATRDPESTKVAAMMAPMPPTVTARRRREVAAHASTIVLAVPFAAVPEALAELGDLSGKVIVDCTNPIAPGLRSLVDPDSSGAQQIAALVPGAKVIKAFNTIGAESMDNPDYGGVAATMLVCGDDLMAKTAVCDLAEDLGFAAVDAGPLSAARHLEALALLWIHLATVQGMGRDIAFRLEQR